MLQRRHIRCQALTKGHCLWSQMLNVLHTFLKWTTSLKRQKPSPNVSFHFKCTNLSSLHSSLRSPWTCNLSVLDYPGAFHQLSKGDIDQLVTTRPLEACTITVDLSMDRITEQHIGGSLRRFQRDLCKQY